MLKDTHTAEIDAILARYADQRSAVLPLLYIAQDTYGHLTQEAIREVADILSMPYTDVFEVVGFYTLFYDRPVGKWVLQVCDDVPCCYLGAEELIATLKHKLGIREEQTTGDGMFTLQRVKCLAACDRAPLLQANLDYVYDVTPEKVDGLLRSLRERAERGEALSVSGRWSEDYEFAPDGNVRLIKRELGDIPTTPPPIPAVAPEAEKVTQQESSSAPAEPARAEVEQRAAQESPVKPSPDRSPASAHPVPEKQAEEGAHPAQAPQRKPPKERR